MRRETNISMLVISLRVVPIPLNVSSTRLLTVSHQVCVCHTVFEHFSPSGIPLCNISSRTPAMLGCHRNHSHSYIRAQTLQYGAELLSYWLSLAINFYLKKIHMQMC